MINVLQILILCDIVSILDAVLSPYLLINLEIVSKLIDDMLILRTLIVSSHETFSGFSQSQIHDIVSLLDEICVSLRFELVRREGCLIKGRTVACSVELRLGVHNRAQISNLVLLVQSLFHMAH